MINGLTQKITAIIGTSLMFIFILGLAESISSGFAGFWGGFPFWVVVLFVFSLILYDLYDALFKSKQDT